MDPYTAEHDAYIAELEADLEDQFAQEDMSKDAEGVARGSRGGLRDDLYKAQRVAALEEAKADLRSREREKAWRWSSEQYERDRRADITAQQLGDESAFRASQQRMQAYQGDRDAAIQAMQLENQFGMGAGEQVLRARMANQAMAQSEAELLNRLGIEGARGAADIGMFNVGQTLQEQDLLNRLGIQAGQMDISTGEADRQAAMQAAQMGEQALQEQARLGIQAFGTGAPLALESDRLADEAAFRDQQLSLQAAQMNRESRLGVAGQRAQQAALAADLGGQYDARQLTRLREMERAGATRRELDQAVLDMSYENYMRRTNWAQDQLNWLQGILAGAPAAQQTYTTAPGPSPVSELLGLGLGAGAINNLFSGGQQGQG